MTAYFGKCPLCGERCSSEHGPQSAILKHVGSVHMTPDVAGYLREAHEIMGCQWFRVGLSEVKPARRRVRKPAND